MFKKILQHNTTQNVFNTYDIFYLTCNVCSNTFMYEFICAKIGMI